MARKKEKKEKQPKTAMALVLEYATVILLAVVLALVCRSFIGQAFKVPSGSMIPTFLEGDNVLASKFSYGIRNPFNNKVWIETWRPQRWDVAIFIYPEDRDKGVFKRKDYVKRVIGLPGETIAMQQGELYINGEKVEDPSAAYDPQDPSSVRSFGPVLVPENQYFMMGDNRDHSSDSRYWGTVDFSLLRGKAWRLYWSWDSSDPGKSFFSRIRFSRIGKKIE